MRVGSIPESPIESLLLRAGRIPTPLLDSFGGIVLARQIMAGASLGLYAALADGPLTAAEVAARRQTAPVPTEKLLGALVGARILDFRDGRFGLTRLARRWLLPDAPQSLHHNLLFRYDEWRLVEGIEEYVRSGRPVDAHASFSDEAWERYQRGMRSVSGLSAAEVVRRTPVPRGARDMLDVGGSHGFVSVSFCLRHPGLSAVILDLPEAVAKAAPILARDLAREGLEGRVVHRPGNALEDDLGHAAWDVVFVGQLVHHFDDATNRTLARRVAQALRPGGVFVIQEVIRPARPGEGGQFGALLDLYFSLTSASGTWSLEEMADWQRGAGLEPLAPVRLRTAPGTGLQIARRRA